MLFRSTGAITVASFNVENLDPGDGARFGALAQQIVTNLRESGLAILITDHNVRETLAIVDRAYLIFEGRVESEGPKDFLLNDPVSRKLYLGESFTM